MEINDQIEFFNTQIFDPFLQQSFGFKLKDLP